MISVTGLLLDDNAGIAAVIGGTVFELCKSIDCNGDVVGERLTVSLPTATKHNNTYYK